MNPLDQLVSSVALSRRLKSGASLKPHKIVLLLAPLDVARSTANWEELSSLILGWKIFFDFTILLQMGPQVECSLQTRLTIFEIPTFGNLSLCPA